MEHLGPWQEFGLIGIIVGSIIFLLFKIILWTLVAHQDLLKQIGEIIKMYQALADNSTKAMERMAASMDKHDEKADERGRYVRDEHKKLIETAEKQLEIANTTCICLDQVKEGLGRINGYKLS
jgi:hypothetical protein